MADLHGYAICRTCVEVFPARRSCPRCRADEQAAEEVAQVRYGVAGETPPRRRVSPGLSRALGRRRTVPGRFTWLREHAALAILAGVGLIFIGLAAAFTWVPFAGM